MYKSGYQGLEGRRNGELVFNECQFLFGVMKKF